MNSTDIMESYINLLRSGGHVEGEPEKALCDASARLGQPFDGAVVTPSATEAIDAAILTARRHFHADPLRYWVVVTDKADLGTTGYALMASDDVGNDRKKSIAPCMPGFAVIANEDLDGLTAPGPRMNLSPFMSREKSPRVAWSKVALVIVPSYAGQDTLQHLAVLKERHGFLTMMDGSAAVMHVEPLKHDLAVWGLAHANNIEGAALMYKEAVKCDLPTLTPATVFARYAAGLFASKIAT